MVEVAAERFELEGSAEGAVLPQPVQIPGQTRVVGLSTRSEREVVEVCLKLSDGRFIRDFYSVMYYEDAFIW